MMDIKNRRRFLKQLAGTGAATVAANFSPVVIKDGPGHVFLTPPYLQDPTANGMVIRWITSLPSYSWVEWGESPSLGQKTHRITNGLVDAYNRINRIALEGLRPGTIYHYRVC